MSFSSSRSDLSFVKGDGSPSASSGKTNKSKITTGLALGLLAALLLGVVVGSLVVLAAVGSKTMPRFLLVDLSGRLIVPTWACKEGSVCDRNALAARPYRSGLFAVSWTPGKTPSDLNDLVDAVWEWRDGVLVHYATGRSVSMGGQAASSVASGLLSLDLGSGRGTVWYTSSDGLGRVSFKAGDGTQFVSAVLGDASPGVFGLPANASTSSYSNSFVALPWSLV